MKESTGPKETILVTCRAEMDVLGKEMQREDILPCEWHTPLSDDPMLYAITLPKSAFSYGLINKSKVFAANFLNLGHKENVKVCRQYSGKLMDIFEHSRLSKAECDSIDCPRIADSTACLECEVIEEIPAGKNILLISKVLKKHIFTNDKRLFSHREGFTTTLQ